MHRYNQVYAEFFLPSDMTPAAHLETTVRNAADPSHQLASLLVTAGLSPLSETGWIRVTGEDRVRWLNGMATNNVQQLKPGEGAYNFILNAQGRIQGDAYIFAEPDTLLIQTGVSQVPRLVPLLDRFIIMDDVELQDVTGAFSGLQISGPTAASMLERVGVDIVNLGPLERRTLPWNGTSITAICAYSPLVPHFELWAEPDTVGSLTSALLAAGVSNVGPESREYLRLLEGTPLFGKDIRDRELPQETGQTRALHFAKGCYLGQEIVERIRSRGNVHRVFGAFQLQGDLPSAGSTLEVDGKQVGELTSVATIPLQQADSRTLQLALGYARREALERRTPLLYPGGAAIPVPAPFPIAEANPHKAASESPERV